MSSTTQSISDAIQPVTSTGGGVYTTRKGRKSIDKNLANDHTDQSIDEENGSVFEKDVLDERNVRVKQVQILTTSSWRPNC
jgi:hypothetical protein